MGYPITGAPPITSLKPGDIDTLAELNALLTDAELIGTELVAAPTAYDDSGTAGQYAISGIYLYRHAGTQWVRWACETFF